VAAAQIVFEVAAGRERRWIGGWGVTAKELVRTSDNVEYAVDFAFNSGVHHGPFLRWVLA